MRDARRERRAERRRRQAGSAKPNAAALPERSRGPFMRAAAPSGSSLGQSKASAAALGIVADFRFSRSLFA